MRCHDNLTLKHYGRCIPSTPPQWEFSRSPAASSTSIK